MYRWSSWDTMTSQTNIRKISLQKIVGGGYGQFWKYKGRYRVAKGSRASKKSKTTALWIIASMMKYPQANTLVIRKVFRTILDSCFTDLQWAAERLGVSNKWDFKLSPLEATYKPTGQKILFRGLDDPMKIASVAVKTGCLCWCWIEEAYEIMNEADFDMIDESIRGEVPEGLFKQITLTFNPWNERHWLKRRFFDVEDPNILALTTNYMCNEFLDEADRKQFEDMKTRNPRRYRTAGLGDWGIVEGTVYENWREAEFTLSNIGNARTMAGLDFGYTNDPTAFFIGFLNQERRIIYVWDEIYKKGLSNEMIYKEIDAAGYVKESITGDSAEPKSIDELYNLGLRIHGARKGKDSVMNGIQFLQNYEMIIHPRCVNFLTEISNYTWDKDRFGNLVNRPIDEFNHLMDAMRYAAEDIQKGDTFSFE